jgi:molecular chaperone HtpG
MKDMPESYNFVVNINHPVMGKVLGTEDDAERDTLVSQLKDLALLSQHLLKGEDLTNFVKRSVGMIG